jgi:hypothetical protein
MGKHIAYLEMYKVVATLLRRFEVCFDLITLAVLTWCELELTTLG